MNVFSLRIDKDIRDVVCDPDVINFCITDNTEVFDAAEELLERQAKYMGRRFTIIEVKTNDEKMTLLLIKDMLPSEWFEEGYSEEEDHPLTEEHFLNAYKRNIR